MEASYELHRCFRCGYCKFPGSYVDLNCPAYQRFRFESYSTGGRLWLIRAWLNGEIAWSPHLAEVVYACTTCRNCMEQCPFKFKDLLLDMVLAGRRAMVEKGLVPPKVKEFLENLLKQGNPWGMSREKRASWAVDLPRYRDGHEYLLYVGCLASYDERAQKTARSLARLLSEAQVPYGILGNEEECDGNEAYMLGEEGLFELLAERNLEKFKELGVKKVVALSPHAYHVMVNLYPKLEKGTLEVLHYTQLLQRLLEEGRLKPSRLEVKVTYHDPCYLGRHNRIFDPPRQVLESIPGLKLLEMERSRENALCCGGGAGNFYIDLLAGRNSPARVRVREAYDTGARVLAVACPACLIMLEDAVKEEGLDGELMVKDVAEVLMEACLRG